MKHIHTKWRLMLVRAYKPFFASIFGNYVPKFFNLPLMVIYKDDWCFWYVPEELCNKYDRDLINTITKRYSSSEEYKKYAENTISLYESSYKKIEELLSNFQNRKGDKMNKSSILDFLGNPFDFDIKKEGVGEKDIKELNTYLSIYGFIIGYPRMSIFGGVGKELREKLFKVYFEKLTGFNRYEDKMLFIDEQISKLTINDDEIRYPTTKYELDLLSVAIKLKNRIFTDIVMYLAEKVSGPVLGDRSSFLHRIERSIIRRVRIQKKEINEYIEKRLDYYLNNSEEIKNLIEKYSPIRSGWNFGKSLDKIEIINRLKSIIQSSVFSNGEKLLNTEINFNWLRIEIKLASLKELYYSVLKYNKKGIFEEIGNICDKKTLKEIMLLAYIFSYEGRIRHWRKIYSYKINYISKNFIKDISECLNWKSWEYIYFLTIKEVVKLLEGTKILVKNEETKKRREAMLIIFDESLENSDDVLVSGDKNVRSYISKFEIIGDNPYFKTSEKITVPKGKPINFVKKDEIKGTVAKIDNDQDLLQVHWDDIIVAKMIESYQGISFVSPQAIIVEDPGENSHAVFVARSKAIPIVVGAKGTLNFARKHHLIGEEKDINKGLKVNRKGEIKIWDIGGEEK